MMFTQNRAKLLIFYEKKEKRQKKQPIILIPLTQLTFLTILATLLVYFFRPVRMDFVQRRPERPTRYQPRATP